METYDNMYKFVCRVCLKQKSEETMVSLLDRSSGDGLSSFGKAVLTFANVDIKPQDVFPTSMCNDCLYCLKRAIYFKLKCETSDKQLTKLAEDCFSEADIKAKVVEYAMFTNYFTDADLHEGHTNSKCEEKSQTFIQNSMKENLVMEIAVSQDSFSDHFPETSDSVHSQTYFENDSAPPHEDGDAILDSIEKLIGSFPDVSSLEFKRSLKKRTFNRHKKLIRRRQMLVNRETESFHCNICQRALANKHSYENHMQRHTGCRFVCEHCGKGFPVLTELQIHQVAVHGTGPYLQCGQCPYKAPRRFNLTEHERIHSGERPYTCEKCGLTFRRRFVWKKHLIYHNEKTVQCELCPRKFFLRSEMLAHCNNVHERVYVYLCNKCGATYAKPVTVRRHLTERHGVPREMQGKIIRINKGKGDFPE